MRTRPDELHDLAVDALVEALQAAGLRAAASAAGAITIEGPRGELSIEVRAVSVLDADRARALLARARNEMGRGRADQISEAAREVLRSGDVGYLDRRGALWLRGPGLFVNDTSIPPSGRPRHRNGAPIRGRVALGVALRTLVHPDERASVREIATELDASVSTVHAALTSLRDAALVNASGEPLVPDLFDATAAVWRPERVPVRRVPDAADADGWVVGGDVGAAAAGAAIVLAADASPDFYVPTGSALRRAVRQLGECAYDDRAATIAVAPSPVVIAEPAEATWSRWPVAHEVVLALDLAQDLARGREIVDEWTPPGVRRVW